jgi:uncharacterized protein (DUF885 family)
MILRALIASLALMTGVGLSISGWARAHAQLVILEPPRAATSALLEPEQVDPASHIGQTTSEMREPLERYAADRASLLRSFGFEERGRRDAPGRQSAEIDSPEAMERLRQFYQGWLENLGKLGFDAMSQDGKVDYLLLKNRLAYELRGLETRKKNLAETDPLIPIRMIAIGLAQARRRVTEIKPAELARTLDEMRRAVEAIDRQVAAGRSPVSNKMVANRAAGEVDVLRETLADWFIYYNGYDPMFTWWCRGPYGKLDKALEDYAATIRGNVVGVQEGDSETIVGDPIGREALMSGLAYEMIPYTPEELIEIAKKEFAWCDAEMLKASRELGFGDDWHAALEHVKTLHVEPGRQAYLIKQLAEEAVKFLDDHDLITVPKLAREDWGIVMMTPERQLVNPFFTGGDDISVSFPTDTMEFEARMMSMRGNNNHFAHATVFHELIPGHHFQGFMGARYNQHRAIFRTPFWGEGWALYWEMLLYQKNFDATPEDRVGALFWRSHRCARIIFSLSFHLGQMTPQQCIDYLVERVGHERENAEAEVRRSFATSYSPLYQCAYMLGGLQIMALHGELVDSGRMSDRDFHDRIIRMNSIPNEMVRALLTNTPLTRDYQSNWRFYGDPAGGQ